MEPHNHKGNCWDRDHIYDCSECGIGNLCDACHSHDEPRGECSVCASCAACEVDEMRRLESGE